MFKKIRYILFIFACCLISLELSTRALGKKAGLIENFRGFQLVDSLETHNLYKLDEFGIYSINTQLFDSLKQFEPSTYPPFVSQENVLDVLQEFNALSSTIDTDRSALARMLMSSTDSTFNFALNSYIESPLNKEGFRSIPFINYKSEHKKILLLGDSFVYGLSASPSYYSFADLLLSKGYLVYNTGITGTDPPQYAAVLEKYILRLQPDIVILNFYQGNDFMLYPRTAAEEEPHEHQTNAGFIESAPLGYYLSAQESYQFYENLISVPKKSLFYDLAKHSTAVSLLYRWLVKLNLIYHEEQREYSDLRDFTTMNDMALNTKISIDAINKIALKSGTPILNVIIPVKPESRRFSDRNYNSYFIDEAALNTTFSIFPYTYPKNLSKEDYEKNGEHFNNMGSKKYADFLDEKIQYTLTN